MKIEKLIKIEPGDYFFVTTPENINIHHAEEYFNRLYEKRKILVHLLIVKDINKVKLYGYDIKTL